MQTFEEFLATIPDEARRTRTREVLEHVARTFPRLQARIAWNQPMFTDHGTFIAGFSVSKKHLAMTPEGAVVERFADEIRKAGFVRTSMLVRFPWDRPVDYALLDRMIAFNIEDKADCSTFWRKGAAPGSKP